jgi:hypothetical protein
LRRSYFENSQDNVNLICEFFRKVARLRFRARIPGVVAISTNEERETASGGKSLPPESLSGVAHFFLDFGKIKRIQRKNRGKPKTLTVISGIFVKFVLTIDREKMYYRPNQTLSR